MKKLSVLIVLCCVGARAFGQDAPALPDLEKPGFETETCAHGDGCGGCASDPAGGLVCTTPPDATAAGATAGAAAGTAADEEVAAIVTYLEKLRDERTDGKIRIDTSAMAEAIGFEPTEDALSRAISTVFQIVPGDGTFTTRCADYGACSLYGDLSFASGEILSMYEQEKGADGARLENLWLPAFKATTLDGEPVTSVELLGGRTVLAPLAVHCRHSYDTIPLLNELAARFGPEGLRVVGILVNSGSVENARQSLAEQELGFEVWVAEGDLLGDVLGTHLVPSHLLIDERGQVRRRFVGFKDGAFLQRQVAVLVGTEAEPAVTATDLDEG